MRALYFTDTYPPQVNGVSVVTELSARGLIARGWEVGVVAPRYPPGADVFGGTRREVLLAPPSWPIPNYPEIRVMAPVMGEALRTARRFAPDLIHCATEFVAGRLGQWVARKLRVPMVTSYHTDFGRYMQSYGLPRLQGVMTRYLTRFHRRADRTFTPSHATRTELLERGIDRAVVWGCGVDAARFHPGERSTEVRWSLAPEDSFIFLHVGRMAPEKSVDRIVAAFARCRARLGSRVTLVLAGDGPSRVEMARSAPTGVLFLGYLDRIKELPALYASADAFVFASETETLGLVVLEAMASGLPVVAAPAGGVADHLRHGVNGLAYRPGDVGQMADFMIELATGSNLRASLAAGARRTAAELSWERELDRLDSGYREVIRLGPASARAIDEPGLLGSHP